MNADAAARANALADSAEEQAGFFKVHPAFFEFLDGNLGAAMMLGRVLVWNASDTVRNNDGWFYKTDKEWQEELCLGRHIVRGAADLLVARGYLEVDPRRYVNGSPKTHYRFDLEKFEREFNAWLAEDEQVEARRKRQEKRAAKAAKKAVRNGLSEIGQSSHREQVVQPAANNSQVDYAKSDNPTGGIVQNQTMHCPKSDDALSEIEQTYTRENTRETNTSSPLPPTEQEGEEGQQVSEKAILLSQLEEWGVFNGKRGKILDAFEAFNRTAPQPRRVSPADIIAQLTLHEKKAETEKKPNGDDRWNDPKAVAVTRLTEQGIGRCAGAVARLARWQDQPQTTTRRKPTFLAGTGTMTTRKR